MVVSSAVNLALASMATLAFDFALAQTEVKVTTLKFPVWGDFKVYQTSSAPKELILFLSDDAGWTTDLDQAAKSLTTEGRVVATLMTSKYRAQMESSKAKCGYPSGDLENVSKFIQAELKFTDYKLPLLIGIGSGASFAYGSFFQAPENTFMAAIGWNFCPSYRAKKMICPGDGMNSQPASGGGFAIAPTKRTLAGWATVNSETAACTKVAAAGFTNAIKDAKFIEGSGNAQTELNAHVTGLFAKAPAKLLQAGAVESLKELPIIELQPEKEIKRGPDDYFVVFYSGDGGWAGFDKVISAEFNKRGVPVVGLSTLSYYWKPKSPEISAEDLRKMMAFYQQKWGIQKVLLLGYSFGADVLPFIVNRLPEAARKNVVQITLLSSSGQGDFEFNFSHWFSSSSSGASMIPELEKLKNQLRIQCIYGSDEKKPFCTKLDAKEYALVKLPGGHRFDGDTPKLVNVIQGTGPKSSP